eukprot:gene30603-35615_t
MASIVASAQSTSLSMRKRGRESEKIPIVAAPCTPSCSFTSDVAYGVATTQGGRRYMEDFHSVVTSDSLENKIQGHSFFMVADGHGGSNVAQHVTQNFYGCLAAEVLPKFEGGSTSPVRSVDDFARALSSTMLFVDEQLPVATSNECGCTALAALLSCSYLVLANSGDSRAVLSRGGTALALTEDHSPDREDEQLRIKAAGGYLLSNSGLRVMGVLAMTRALGDKFLREYGVIPDPDVTSVDLHKSDEFLLLASDGLWNFVSNQEAVDIARLSIARAESRGASKSMASRIAARVLMRCASDRGSQDNITVIVVDLTQKLKEQGDELQATLRLDLNLNSPSWDVPFGRQPSPTHSTPDSPPLSTPGQPSPSHSPRPSKLGSESGSEASEASDPSNPMCYSSKRSVKHSTLSWVLCEGDLQVIGASLDDMHLNSKPTVGQSQHLLSAAAAPVSLLSSAEELMLQWHCYHLPRSSWCSCVYVPAEGDLQVISSSLDAMRHLHCKPTVGQIQHFLSAAAAPSHCYPLRRSSWCTCVDAPAEDDLQVIGASLDDMLLYCIPTAGPSQHLLSAAAAPVALLSSAKELMQLQSHCYHLPRSSWCSCVYVPAEGDLQVINLSLDDMRHLHCKPTVGQSQHLLSAAAVAVALLTSAKELMGDLQVINLSLNDMRHLHCKPTVGQSQHLLSAAAVQVALLSSAKELVVFKRLCPF